MFMILVDANLTSHQSDSGVFLPIEGEYDLLGIVMLNSLFCVRAAQLDLQKHSQQSAK
jgi:hypothetical protein